MRRMKINGYKLADIADKFKVSRTTVSLHTSGYKKGRRWHYHNVRELIIKNNYDYGKAGKEVGLKRSYIAFLANKFGLLEETGNKERF